MFWQSYPSLRYVTQSLYFLLYLCYTKYNTITDLTHQANTRQSQLPSATDKTRLMTGPMHHDGSITVSTHNRHRVSEKGSKNQADFEALLETLVGPFFSPKVVRY